MRKAAVKELQANKTTSPLVQQRQRALNDICTCHIVRLYWVPGHARLHGNEIANKLARDSSTQQFIGPETSVGVSRQNINNKIKHWVDNQQLARWHGAYSSQRERLENWFQALAPLQRHNYCPWNRTQSRVVTCLLNGHNTVRRHVYVMGLSSNNRICRKCGTEVVTSVHVVCKCKVLASLRHEYLGFLLFGPWGCYKSK